MKAGSGKSDYGGTRAVVIMNRKGNVLYGFKFTDHKEDFPGLLIDLFTVDDDAYTVYLHCVFPERASVQALWDARKQEIGGMELARLYRAVEAEITLAQAHVRHLKAAIEHSGYNK